MTPEISLRPCAVGDEALLSILGQASFYETFAGIHTSQDILAHCRRNHSEEAYHAWLTDPTSRVWAADVEPGRAAVGYLLLTPADLPVEDRQSGDWEIKRIYLLHRFQGLGIGRMLMETARTEAERLNASRLLLGVYAQNTSAIAFYQRLGYQPIGTRTFQVGTVVCEDLILGLRLTDSGN